MAFEQLTERAPFLDRRTRGETLCIPTDTNPTCPATEVCKPTSRDDNRRRHRTIQSPRSGRRPRQHHILLITRIPKPRTHKNRPGILLRITPPPEFRQKPSLVVVAFVGNLNVIARGTSSPRPRRSKLGISGGAECFREAGVGFRFYALETGVGGGAFERWDGH